MRLRLTKPAELDIAEALDRSREQFGVSARDRYKALIRAALLDIRRDPYRRGSRTSPEIAHVRLYHVRYSQRRTRADRVTSPRHILVYHVRPEVALIEILRVLHDAMDIAQHVPPDQP